MLWANNALNEFLHGPAAIDDDWEFHSRVGGGGHEVQALDGRYPDNIVDVVIGGHGTNDRHDADGLGLRVQSPVTGGRRR